MGEQQSRLRVSFHILSYLEDRNIERVNICFTDPSSLLHFQFDPLYFIILLVFDVIISNLCVSRHKYGVKIPVKTV